MSSQAGLVVVYKLALEPEGVQFDGNATVLLAAALSNVLALASADGYRPSRKDRAPCYAMTAVAGMAPASARAFIPAWTNVPPMLPRSRSRTNLPPVPPPVTRAAPAANFQSHQNETIGTMYSQVVGTDAPCAFISPRVLASHTIQ